MAFETDSLVTPVARTGGKEPGAFPHVCPYQPTGAAADFCRKMTENFQRNKEGCFAHKCNCELRRCIMCLAMNRKGKDVKGVVDPAQGLCSEHLEEAAQPFQKAGVPPKPVVRPAALAAPPAPSPPRPSVTERPQNPLPAKLPTLPVVLKPVSPQSPADAPSTGTSVAQRALEGEILPPIKGLRFDENSRWRPLIERAQRALAESIQIDIPPEQIRPMPNQPRKFFGEEGIMRLADSFKIVGQIIRGFVRKVSDGKNGVLFELIDGERRWRAAKLAGLPFKAIVIEVDDAALAFIIAAVANFNRADHTATEISDSIEAMRLADLRMEEIAEMIGISLHWAYQLHGLQKLHPEVRDLLDPNLPQEKQLGVSAAIQISKAEEYLQLGLARKFMDGDVTLRGLRKEVVKVSVEHSASVRVRAAEPARKFDSMQRHAGVLRRSIMDLKQMLEEEKSLPAFFSDRNKGQVVLLQGSLKGTREMIAQCERLIAEALK